MDENPYQSPETHENPGGGLQKLFRQVAKAILGALSGMSMLIAALAVIGAFLDSKASDIAAAIFF